MPVDCTLSKERIFLCPKSQIIVPLKRRKSEADEILRISSWKLALRLISQINMPLTRRKERKTCRYLRN